MSDELKGIIREFIDNEGYLHCPIEHLEHEAELGNDFAELCLRARKLIGAAPAAVGQENDNG